MSRRLTAGQSPCGHGAAGNPWPGTANGFGLAGADGQRVEAGFIYDGNLLVSTRGVISNDPLFIVIKVTQGLPGVSYAKHLANVLGHKSGLAVDQHGADFVLAVAVLDPRKKRTRQRMILCRVDARLCAVAPPVRRRLSVRRLPKPYRTGTRNLPGDLHVLFDEFRDLSSHPHSSSWLRVQSLNIPPVNRAAHRRSLWQRTPARHDGHC